MRRYSKEVDSESSSSILLNMEASTSATAQSLLQSDYLHSGQLLKKNSSLMAYFCPWCFKAWKSRFCILIGNFLFKFENEWSDKPKGVPIPIDSCDIKILSDDDDPAYYAFSVSTLRKTYIFRALSKESRNEWVNAFRNRKHISIKENLGHGINSILFTLQSDS